MTARVRAPVLAPDGAAHAPARPVAATAWLDRPVAGFLARLGGALILLHFLLIDGGNRSRYEFGVSLVSQTLVVAVLGGWLAYHLLRRRPPPRTAADPAIGLYLAVAGGSLVFAADRRVSLEALPPLLAGVLAFYLLVDLWRAGAGRVIVPAFVLAGTAVGLTALAEFAAWYLGLFPAGLRPGTGSWLDLVPAFGPLPPVLHRFTYAANANHLAALVALALPFTIVPLIVSQKRPERVAALAGLLALLALLVLSLSRGGLVAATVAGIGSVALAFAAAGRRVRRPAWPALALLGLLGVVPAVLLGPHFVALLRPETLANRFPIWGPALDIFRQHPLTGVGPGGFGLALSAYTDRVPGLPLVQLAHSGPLQVAAEFGVLGLVSAALLLATLVVVWHRRWTRATALERRYLAATGAALLGFAAANLFDAYFTFQLVMLPVTALVVWLVAFPAPARLVLGAGPNEPCEGGPDVTWADPGGGTRRTLPRLPLLALAALAALAVTVAFDAGRAAYVAGRGAAQAGDFRAAEAHLRDAVAADPTFAYYARQLARVRGQIAEGAGSPVERRAWAEAALAAYAAGRTGAQPVDLVNEARVADLAGQPDRALESAEAAVARDPWDATALLALGQAREAAGDRAGAIDAYARAIARRPEARRATFWQATTERQALLPAIDARVPEALAADPALSPAERHRRQAEAAIAAGNTEAAVAALAALPDDDYTALGLRGRQAERAGDWVTALAAYQAAYANAPVQDEYEIARAAAAYAALLARAGRPDDARPLLGLARFYLDDPEIAYRRAQVARFAGDRAAALGAYNVALAVAYPEQARFAPNALSRAAILPQTLPGVARPLPDGDVAERARERAELVAE